MARIELLLFAFFLACWLVGLLALLDIAELAGNLRLGLYQLYGVAALLGWLAGNVYVHRSRRLPDPFKGRLLVLYFLGPLGLLYLLRAMAPTADQAGAPFVPLYSFGVLATFFLVPVALRESAPKARDLQIGRRPRDEE